MVELETIVTKMEQGDLPLEEALSCFEKGIRLVRDGQIHLKNAEQKVQILMQQTQQLENFDDSQESDN